MTYLLADESWEIEDESEEEEMRTYMNQMDQELSQTTLGKSFEKVGNFQDETTQTLPRKLTHIVMSPELQRYYICVFVSGTESSMDTEHIETIHPQDVR